MLYYHLKWGLYKIMYLERVLKCGRMLTILQKKKKAGYTTVMISSLLKICVIE